MGDGVAEVVTVEVMNEEGAEPDEVVCAIEEVGGMDELAVLHSPKAALQPASQ